MSDRCVDCGYHEPPRTIRRIGGGMTLSIEQLEALAACPVDVCPGHSCCFYRVGRYASECLRPEEPREIARLVLELADMASDLSTEVCSGASPETFIEEAESRVRAKYPKEEQ